MGKASSFLNDEEHGPQGTWNDGEIGPQESA
jgi:hypothetical protein